MHCYLTQVGGRDALLNKFKSAKHFASWLGLCPDNRISGNKRLGSKTRKVKSRLACQLRMAAMTLWRNNSALGEYCRKMKARLGQAEGIAAAAHKIARIIYSLITKGGVYDDNLINQMTESRKNKRVQNLRKSAAKLGLQLISIEALQPIFGRFVIWKKWAVHRFLRPEECAGRWEAARSRGEGFPLHERYARSIESFRGRHSRMQRKSLRVGWPIRSISPAAGSGGIRHAIGSHFNTRCTASST